MLSASSFPFDLVIFAFIAAFLVLRLRSILGRRTGFERQSAPAAPAASVRAAPVIEGKAEPKTPERALPDPASPAGQGLASIQARDPSFTPQVFLEGAERAFGVIVAAFAAGDRSRLRPLLGDATYEAFDNAITARDAAGEKQTSQLRYMARVTIDAATLADTVATIMVQFVSDQVSYLADKDGKILVGTDGVTELTDLWSFERDLAQKDHAWKLVGAETV